LPLPCRGGLRLEAVDGEGSMEGQAAVGAAGAGHGEEGKIDLYPGRRVGAARGETADQGAALGILIRAAATEVVEEADDFAALGHHEVGKAQVACDLVGGRSRLVVEERCSSGDTGEVLPIE